MKKFSLCVFNNQHGRVYSRTFFAMDFAEAEEEKDKVVAECEERTDTWCDATLTYWGEEHDMTPEEVEAEKQQRIAERKRLAQETRKAMGGAW